MLRPLLPALLGCFLALSPVFSRVEPLPALVRSDAWEPAPAPAAQAHLRVIAWPQAPETLGLGFSGESGQSADLLLREPLPVPEWATGWTAMLLNEGGKGRLEVLAVVEDSQHHRFLYRMLRPLPDFQSGYPVFKPGYRAVPERLNAEGFKRPKVGPGQWDTIRPLALNRQPPVPPLTLIGLRLVGGNPGPVEATVGLEAFAWTRLEPQQTSVYYALEGRETFGDLDPRAALPLGALGNPVPGEMTVRWDLRNVYEGVPLLHGEGKWTIRAGEGAEPLCRQWAQKLELPALPPGTYWVRTRLLRGPQPPLEKEWRLDVIHSRENAALPAASQGVAPALELGADGALLVQEPGQPKKPLAVRFAPGDAKEAGGKEEGFRVEIRSHSDNRRLRERSGPLEAGAATEVSVDLAGLPGNLWTIRAERLAGGRVVDAIERVAGVREATAGPQEKQPLPPAPADPTHGQSKIVLFPQIPDALREDPVKRWEALQPFLEQAGTVSHLIEMPIRWTDLEVLPGVYDWGWLDRFMDEAQKRKLRVLIDLQFMGREPAWVPACFSQNREGAVFGHQRYLFRGMRCNFWQAAPLREAVLRLFRTVATRYRGHPACEGFLILTEHPGEYPYTGWYEGYDPQTKANFREAARADHGDLKTLNARWGTRFPSWEAIEPPEAGASDRYRLDWLAFRREKIAALLLDQVRTVRAAAPESFIVLYGDGLTGRHYPEVRSLGVILANGGANEPELRGLQSAALAAYGLQERAEERSVGRWAAYGPRQLEATLFTMLYGGGGNAHCKAFIRSDQPFEALRPDPYALARFEAMIPLWQELRATQAPQWSAFILNHLPSRLLAADSTTFISYGNSNTVRSFLEAQHVAPLVEANLATTGRLLYCLSTYGTAYETPLVEQLAQYVENGGRLVMSANAGRTDPDRPGEDWVLLRRLGFAPPQESARPRKPLVARTQAGAVFPQAGRAFSLEAPSWVPQESEGVLARFEDGSPAMTLRPYGKGEVVVLWASGVIPPSRGEPYPFLADVARWAGVASRSSASDFHFYTNLLVHRDGRTHYGLVYRTSTAFPWGQTGEPVEARTRWELPEGRYRVSERLSGRDLGIVTAATLREEGLPTSLAPHAVAVYRMEAL